jgi:predicted lipid-binding transport protein (Tim44 family)
MSDFNDMLAGNGSEADFLNAYGSSYEDNQTAFDVADNGKVTSTDTTTTVNSPGWASSLSSLFGLASTGANVVSALTGKTTAPAATVAAPAAGTSVSSGGMSTMLLVGIGLALLVGAFLFFRRR